MRVFKMVQGTLQIFICRKKRTLSPSATASTNLDSKWNLGDRHRSLLRNWFNNSLILVKYIISYNLNYKTLNLYFTVSYNISTSMKWKCSLYPQKYKWGCTFRFIMKTKCFYTRTPDMPRRILYTEVSCQVLVLGQETFFEHCVTNEDDFGADPWNTHSTTDRKSVV